MKIKTSKLTGRALDWAVCVAEGNKPVMNPHRFGSTSWGAFDSELGYAIKNYSTDPTYSWPIIEREKIDLIHHHATSTVTGIIWRFGETPHTISGEGLTPLIAAMRCYVASKLGDEVEVPARLALCRTTL